VKGPQITGLKTRLILFHQPASLELQKPDLKCFKDRQLAQSASPGGDPGFNAHTDTARA